MAVVTALISGASDIQLNILLQHPLLQAFLRLKWNSMRIIFFLLLILHVSFVGSISYHILYRVKSKESLEKVEKAQVEVHVEISRRLLLTSVIVLLINVLCQLAIVPKRSLRQLETWLNVVCIILALGTVLWGESNDTGQTLMATSWILHTESILVLLAWVELMLLIGRFSSWGYYALMFYTVLRNVVKSKQLFLRLTGQPPGFDSRSIFILSIVCFRACPALIGEREAAFPYVLLTFVCLVIGFAFSFYIQFQEEAQFCDIWRSFVKTTVMMMGEFDYGDLFTEPKSPNSITRLPATSRIIFLLFVILASIVLMNLMVGLAVSDIQALQTEGHIHRLLKQADFIDQLEKMSNHRILRSSCCPQQLFRILNKRRSIPIRITIQPSNNVRGVARLPYNLLEAVVAIALHNQQLNGIKDHINYR
ncbi:unnamed protein product [Timema podura]|uniref:Ion transport domain-containing protein n=1 Tax=Timema podura TaxID=61482 RepID=A0ABN7P9N8_TIMPD|nr:unnamed protein product [Timema podura]